MFVTNYSSIPSNAIVLVDITLKRYLESCGFCPISYDEVSDKYAFTKTKEIMILINEREGGNDG